jgi:Apea-like HEPN
MPFSEFVRATLAKDLYDTGEYTAAQEPIALTSLDQYRDFSAASARLIEAFISLPWKYVLSIALPLTIGNLLNKTAKPFALSTTIRIVSPDETFVKQYPTHPGSNTFLGARLLADILGGEPQWQTTRSYLQIYVDGFIPLFGNTVPLDDSIDHIKSFFGLGLALRLFQVNRSHGESPATVRVWAHQLIDDQWQYERSIDLDRSVSSLLDSLEPDDFNREFDSGKLQTLAAHQLQSIATVFSQGSASRRLLLAAQWLFDSHKGSDERLSFVQAAVVLEILLGDKATSDVVGLGELLRNCCAYLISQSHSQRQQVLDDFRRIYDVRSHIVHAGKKRLNLEEWGLFSKLRWICQRAIQEEVRLFTGLPRPQ